ncbi:hypothetical protein SUDANB95_04811 [Actinosynnema sp. ALI-1.44]
MLIRIEKTDSGGHVATARRDDGIVVLAYENDHPHRVPHELAHYLVEDHLRMDWGYWGSIAQGMVFRSMSVLDGDRESAAARSAAVSERFMKRIGVAETLISAVEEVLPLTGTVPAEDLRARMVRKYPQLDGAPLEDLDFAEVERLMAAAADEWAAVPEGGVLELEWRVPPS